MATQNKIEDRADNALVEPSDLATPPVAALPAVVPPPRIAQRRRLSLRRVSLLLVLLAGALSAGYWWVHPRQGLSPGIASGNGRLEADEIDIDTKFAGRVAKLFVEEGDIVTAGHVVAMMDTRDLLASLKKSEALVSQAQRALDEANANLVQQQTLVTLAQQELYRTSALVPKGYATLELLDQQTQRRNAAIAAENAATHRVAEAQHALDAATHDVELYRVNILDNTLVAPRDGPIEYRVANVGEVVPAGGKVLTMLDASYVYMDIYLPTAQAGRVTIGSEARIVLDAYPDQIIPAKVVFIASQAQFTPKTVETKEEREKLMFRIRVRIDPDRLKTREAMVRSGLPGVAYVRTDPSGTWPSSLEPSALPVAPPSAPIPAPR
jgi:HlyD family secretion protein